MKTQTQKNTSAIERLMNPSFRQDLFHPNRILYTLVFCALFVFIGYYAPRVYLEHFDTYEYYQVEQPVLTDKHIYKPCEKIVATIVRTSRFNMEGHSVVQLYLVNGNSLSKSYPLFNDDIIIDQSDQQAFNVTYTLPCDISNGKYYIQALIKYQINGIDKSYIWRTVVFSIEK